MNNLILLGTKKHSHDWSRLNKAEYSGVAYVNQYKHVCNHVNNTLRSKGYILGIGYYVMGLKEKEYIFIKIYKCDFDVNSYTITFEYDVIQPSGQKSITLYGFEGIGDNKIIQESEISKFIKYCKEKRYAIPDMFYSDKIESNNSKGGMEKMVNVFISYCQKDGIYAENIDLYFKDKDIVLHRDIRDISSWKSIREYMQSIRDMDYAILIITDNYLKSFNCMYEVLEVMKERNFQDKIFPVVVETSIYNPSGRIKYIAHWQDEFKKLKDEMNKIDDVINAGSIIDDLKRTQNIIFNIDEFLGKVADMNNPSIPDIKVSIENKLREHGLLRGEQEGKSIKKNDTDIFSKLDIPKMFLGSEPTDLEKNKFMANSFSRINTMLGELCKQLEKENGSFQVEIDEVDSRTITYEFYRNGSQVRALRLFLGNSFGGKEYSIGISCERFSMGSNNSYNGMFSPKVENGQLMLCSIFSMSGQKTISVEEAVKEIWISYIKPYIER